jgi:flagellar biosynthesis protein FlhG
MNRTDAKPRQRPYAIAVGGGKGGVGKSVIALNLALAMTKLGARVTLVDADLGSANLHTMLGIDHPGVTLQALFDGRARELAEVCIATGFQNLQLVPGSVAVPGAANLQHARKLKLIRQLDKLDCDVVVLDCGAGIHFNVLDFFTTADLQLLVVTPQLVSLQNAYGFLKAGVYRLLRRRAQQLGKAELVDGATDNTEIETVHKLLGTVAASDRELARALYAVLNDARVVLLGNQLGDAREKNALHALSRMISDFLCLRVPVLGALSRKDRIHAAVSRRRPFVADSSEPEAKLLLQLAERFLNERAAPRGRERDTTGDFELADSGGRRDPFARAASNTAVPPPLPTALSHYERAHDRRELGWIATVEVSGQRVPARVLDASAGGLRLELTLSCEPGAQLRIVIPRAGAIVLSARVVHASGGVVGCVFDPEPSPEALAALIRSSSAPPTAGQTADEPG